MRGKTRLLEDRGGPEHSSAGRPAGNTRNKLQSVIQAEGEPSFPKMLMSAHLEGSGVQIPGEAGAAAGLQFGPHRTTMAAHRRFPTWP